MPAQGRPILADAQRHHLPLPMDPRLSSSQHHHRKRAVQCRTSATKAPQGRRRSAAQRRRIWCCAPGADTAGTRSTLTPPARPSATVPVCRCRNGSLAWSAHNAVVARSISLSLRDTRAASRLMKPTATAHDTSGKLSAGRERPRPVRPSLGQQPSGVLLPGVPVGSAPRH